MTAMRRLLLVVVMALIYFGAGQLVFATAEAALSNRIVSIVIFLSEGFALAGVLIYGRWLVVGIFAGQLALALSAGLSLGAATAIAAVNSAEALLALTLFDRFRLDRSLATVRDVAGLLMLIALVLQPFSAVLGNLVLLAYSVLPLEAFGHSLFSWWFGNVLGQFLITPLLLLLWANARRIRLLPLLGVVVSFLMLNYIILFLYPIDRLAIILSITLPPIMLLAAYGNIVYSVVATTIIALAASYATHHGSGAFATGEMASDFVDLNFYILVHVILVLLLGALFSERRRAEQQLKQKNRSLEEMVRLREQVELMSRHELKNALNVIVNAPEVVLETEPGLSEFSRELLQGCKESGYTMLELVNRSLDIYKIETGSYELVREQVDLLAVLERIASESALAGQGGVVVSARQREGVHVSGETLLCYSLFSNLIKNALEASASSGPVEVTVAPSDDGAWQIVTISNRGCVPEAIRERFFDKFVTTGKRGGTGLGTYAARLCAEVQGGSVELDCSDAEWTRIVVRLPAHRSGTSKAATAESGKDSFASGMNLNLGVPTSERDDPFGSGNCPDCPGYVSGLEAKPRQPDVVVDRQQSG